MADTKTRFQEFVEDEGRHRIFEQESLAFEATELISTLLKEQKLSRADLAKRIGRSKAYVTQLLGGGRNMTLHTFADLAFALGHKVELNPCPLAKAKGEIVLYQGRIEIEVRNSLQRRASRVWKGGVPGGSDTPAPWTMVDFGFGA